MKPVDAVNTLGKYFHEMDEAFDRLSHGNEGAISNLPNDVFGKRHIHIFKIAGLDFYLIKVIVNNELDTDKAFTGIVKTNLEIKQICYPLEFDLDITKPPSDYGMVVHNISVKEVGNLNAMPVVNDAMLAIVREDRFFSTFSPEKAKEHALNAWNNIGQNLDNNYSFVHNLTKIFDKLSGILQRESFLERRVHRFINTHKSYILPQFKKCHFEHPLFFKGEKRVADFIIERESGFPSLLIELENPTHRVFKKNDELTHIANHAGEQIKEWVKFIEGESKNSEGEMEFLRGPKDRLVIIGRGLDNIEAMKDTKYGECTVWTYDLLIEEAKTKWNNFITEQCAVVGIANPNLLN